MTSEVYCLYCGEQAKLVKGSYIYPHRKDLAYLNFYSCKGTDEKPHDHAYVGTHKGTTVPLGRLADSTLRDAKQRAHRVFDRIWREGHMKRGEAYHWLSKVMKLHKNVTHIGMFTENQCEQVILHSQRKLLELESK